MRFTFIITLVALSYVTLAQQNKIQSGPMLGYAEMREAVVWIQLKESGKVHAEYDDLSTEENEEYRTAAVQTKQNEAHTARLYFTEVEPGRSYSYQIVVDGQTQEFEYPLEFETAPLWEYRRDPPEFSMAMGSCAYINEKEYDRPGKGYGGQYEIFESITDAQPDAMLWLGDNTYLRPADWWTRTGYLKRYTHTRSLPEIQKLLASSNNFAIWDDHDFGPNNASGSWVHKDLALEAFKLFWVNPTIGFDDFKGTMGAFRYRDVDFVLMDNRYHRTEQRNNRPSQIFGREQCDKLIDLLMQSQAPFKIVATGGQFLSSAPVYENHANYPEERQYLLDRLEEENIKGVIFLSGDRHHSEAMQYTLPGGNHVHEFTVSPLTSSANKNQIEENKHRIEGSLIQERNYAIMKLSGPRQKRVLHFQYFDAQGKALYEQKIKAEDLYK